MKYYGREGTFNDAKPTINEVQRDNLTNNELLMRQNMQGFYKVLKEETVKSAGLLSYLETKRK